MHTTDRTRVILLLLILALQLPISGAIMPKRELVATEGQGYLERLGTVNVLHLKGTPTEMGVQYGTLMREDIRKNIRNLEKKVSSAAGPMQAMAATMFDGVWRSQQRYIPHRYTEELRAMAKAAGIPYDTACRVNTVPELFHCSGFAVFGKATKNGNLYHGRILDYGVDAGLQDHMVVIIYEPEGHTPFVAVSYSGFTGVVTGMNLNGLGFGEMGGKGYGEWDGTPMSFLMRKGLEEADSLDKAKSIFKKNKRTCEYFYVISDAKIPSALGIGATPREIAFVGPNEAKMPLNVPIEDAVVLSANERYQLLTERIKASWGKLDVGSCIKVMRRPVSMRECLHAVLMSPGTQEMWVANATHEGLPASEQPYTYLNIPVLMKSMPQATAAAPYQP